MTPGPDDATSTGKLAQETTCQGQRTLTVGGCGLLHREKMVKCVNLECLAKRKAEFMLQQLKDSEEDS